MPTKKKAGKKRSKKKSDSLPNLIKNVELRGIRLVGSNTALTADLPAKSGEATMKLEQEFKYREVLEPEHLLGVIATFRLQSFAESDKEPTNTQLFSIDSSFLFLYNIRGRSWTEKEQTLFATNTVAFQAWPYFREFVQNMASRMGLPSMVVPLMKRE